MIKNRELGQLSPLNPVFFALMSLGALLLATNANAVPSFARQTGMACSSCHTVFPKLTAFGRLFKLNGYTITGLQQIESKAGESAPGLKVNAIAPMSAMVQTAMTHVKKEDPNTENNHIAYPSALSLYYAGEVSDHVGAFVQVTMDNAQSSFGFDMADMRYANSVSLAGTPVTYGIALDNMPGMGDLWNTTPAWTYPYLAASPDHGSGPVINSLMGAGLAAYAMVDNHLYAYLADYQPMNNSKVMANGMGNFHSDSPYWRLAWQGNVGSGAYLEVGTYGVATKVYGTTTATSDKFTDTALDAQFELPVDGNDQFNAHAVYIHESQHLNASNAGAPKQHINQGRADVAYIVGDHLQYQLGYFNSSGTTAARSYDGEEMMWDTFGGNSSGYVAEFDYLPWENTKFSLQYTAYNEFNGNTGSAASDSNTFVANAWFMW